MIRLRKRITTKHYIKKVYNLSIPNLTYKPTVSFIVILLLCNYQLYLILLVIQRLANGRSKIACYRLRSYYLYNTCFITFWLYIYIIESCLKAVLNDSAPCNRAFCPISTVIFQRISPRKLCYWRAVPWIIWAVYFFVLKFIISISYLFSILYGST